MTTVEFAQELRSDASMPERMLWNRLRSRQMNGWKFRRQHPMEPYVLDFYCPELKMAVEVDGWSHGAGDRPERDQKRDAFLNAQGITVMRVQASDVMKRLDDVLYRIFHEGVAMGSSPLGGKRHDGEAE